MLFFQPDRERGFKMLHGHPETPLLRTKGERGFVFCGPGKNAWQKIWDQDVGINHDSLQLTAKLKTT
jgi:hypothetical protein